MSAITRICWNGIYKLVVFPAIITLLPRFQPQHLSFSSHRPVVFLSSLFIPIGLIADETILPRFGNLPSTIQGALFMTLVSRFYGTVSRQNRVTWFGATMLGIVLGLCEWIMHRWLLQRQDIH